MLEWLRERLPLFGNAPVQEQVVSNVFEVIPTRKVSFFAGFSSPKEARLRSLFEVGAYQAPAVSVQHLNNCVIDTSSGLVACEM